MTVESFIVSIYNAFKSYMSTGREGQGDLTSGLDLLEDHSLKSFNNFRPVDSWGVAVPELAVITGAKCPTGSAVNWEWKKIFTQQQLKVNNLFLIYDFLEYLQYRHFCQFYCYFCNRNIFFKPERAIVWAAPQDTCPTDPRSWKKSSFSWQWNNENWKCWY